MFAIESLLRVVEHNDWEHVAADLLNRFFAQRVDESPQNSSQPRRVGNERRVDTYIRAELAANREPSLLIERSFLELQPVDDVGGTMDGRDSSRELGDRVARLSLGKIA